MELQRKYLWLLVICGMIFTSFIITLIFVFINRCISRSGKHGLLAAQRRSHFSNHSNKYQEGNLNQDSVPQLPPRTQFLSEELQNYENLAESPAEKTKDTHNDFDQTSHDYEEFSDMNNYEEPNNTDNQGLELYMQPDYVKVDSEMSVDNISTEDYDDIGDEDVAKEEQEEEDYDDIGDDDVEEEDYDDVC